MKHINYTTFLIIVMAIGSVHAQNLEYDTDLWMPDTIPLAYGNTIELYTNDVAFIRLDEDRLQFQWECEVGNSDSTQWNWTADQINNFSLTLYCYYSGNLIDSALTVIQVSDKVSMAERNILTIGNSLTAGGYSYQFSQILSDLNIELNAIGTQGSSIKHEGHSGWQFESFTGSSSPFYINNQIDFKKYIENNGLSNPDIIRISLGINDCYLSSPMDYIMNNANLLIDAISRDYPQSIITIALPTSCEGTGVGWLAAYNSLSKYERYQLRIRDLWKRIYEYYGNNQYNKHVFVSYDGLCIDRINGYPTDNGVHPNQQGYKELARGFSNTLNHALSINNSLTENKKTAEIKLTECIYPLPVTDQMIIKNLAPESMVSVYDLTGKKIVQDQNKGEDNLKFNTTSLPYGLYIVSIINLKEKTNKKLKALKL